MSEHSLLLSFKLLNFAGVHPERILKLLVIFNHLILVLVTTLSITKYILDPQMEYLESLSLLFQIIVRYQILVFNQDALRLVLYQLKYFWDLNFENSRNNLVLRYINWQKYYVIYLAICVVLLAIFGTVLPGHTIFNCYVPNGVPRWLVLIAETYTNIFGAAIYAGWNLLFCILILLGVLQLRMLNDKLKNSNLSQIKNGYQDKVCLNTIKGHVYYHNLLLRYIKHLNDALSLPITIFMGNNIFTICMCMYNLQASETLLLKLRSIGLCSLFILEFFIFYGLPAQMLMDEIAATGDSVYHGCEWYLPNIIPIRKCLIMVLIRSQNTSPLSAENFIDINNTTVIFMVKTAYSFLTFFRTRNLTEQSS